MMSRFRKCLSLESLPKITSEESESIMVMILGEDKIKLVILLKKRQKDEECCSRETIPEF